MAHCGGGGGGPGPAASVESHFQGLLDDDDKYRALCGAFGYLQQQEWPDLSGACYAAFGAPPPGTSNGAGNSFSRSGSASSGGGSTKRKPDAYLDAKELVPGCDKVTGKAGMLDEIINYVQSLQKQVEFLSMKIAAANPVVNFNIVDDLFGGRRMSQPCGPAAALPAMTLPMHHGQLDPSCLQMSNTAMQQMQQPAAGFGLDMVLNHPYPLRSAAATPASASAATSVESCLDVNGAAAWDIASQNLFSGFDAQFQSVQSE